MRGGALAQAEQACNSALAVAREWTNDVPTSVAAQRYLALSLNRLGDALRQQKRYDDGAAAYQEALAVRHRLAEAEPDDPQRQIDLIGAHMNLFDLSSARHDKTQAKTHWDEASRLYDGLVSRDPFKASYDPLQSGSVALVLMFAGVLTLVIGLVALAHYRRVIARWMKAAAEASATSGPATTVARAHLVEGQSDISLLSIDAQGVGSKHHGFAPQRSPAAHAPLAERRGSTPSPA